MLPTSVYPTALFDKLDTFLLEFEQHDAEITAGVASVGDAAAYALVWEWGNVRQEKPGPKTVLGTNPDGKMIWLSSQAPFGYIRINEPGYWKIVREVLAGIDFNQPNAKAMTRELERGARKIAKQMTELTKTTVPVDRGDLQRSLTPVNPGDPFLETTHDEYETLTLDEE